MHKLESIHNFFHRLFGLDSRFSITRIFMVFMKDYLYNNHKGIEHIVYPEVKTIYIQCILTKHIQENQSAIVHLLKEDV